MFVRYHLLRVIDELAVFPFLQKVVFSPPNRVSRIIYRYQTNFFNRNTLESVCGEILAETAIPNFPRTRVNLYFVIFVYEFFTVAPVLIYSSECLVDEN